MWQRDRNQIVEMEDTFVLCMCHFIFLIYTPNSIIVVSVTFTFSSISSTIIET